MSNVAYYRVSSSDQSIEAQKSVIEKTYKIDEEFIDSGVSGAIKAKDRKGFNECIKYLRKDDTLIVYDVDRLGRDSIDVQQVVAELKEKKVNILIHRLGIDLNSEVGELVFILMTKFAEMERNKIKARTEAGRKAAREAGKHMGRPLTIKIEHVAQCRNDGLSITATAKQLNCSIATVKAHTKKAREQGLIKK